jgi:hypothetical protein
MHRPRDKAGFTKVLLLCSLSGKILGEGGKEASYDYNKRNLRTITIIRRMLLILRHVILTITSFKVNI